MSDGENIVGQLFDIIKQQNQSATDQRDAQLIAINQGFADLRTEIRTAIRYAALMGVVTIGAVVVLAGGTVWLKTANLEVSAHADSQHTDMVNPTPPVGPGGGADFSLPMMSVEQGN